MPAVVYHPYHRDTGTHPLPTDRSALLNEQREYKTYVTNYQTDVWDVERAVPTKTSTAASSASTRSTLRSRSCRGQFGRGDGGRCVQAYRPTAPSRTRTTPSGTARDGLLSTRRGTHRARASTASLPSGTSPRTSRKRPSASGPTFLAARRPTRLGPPCLPTTRPRRRRSWPHRHRCSSKSTSSGVRGGGPCTCSQFRVRCVIVTMDSTTIDANHQ